VVRSGQFPLSPSERLFESFDTFTLVGKKLQQIHGIRHHGTRKSLADRIDCGSR
jgi:hypothetical protein